MSDRETSDARDLARTLAAALGDDVARVLLAAIDAAAERAAERAEKARAQESRAQKRSPVQYNAELLLKHYRRLKTAHTDAVYNLMTFLGSTDSRQEEVHDMMTRIISRFDLKIESIEKSAARTHMLVQAVDAALADYERECNASGAEHMTRRWRVLYARYIADVPDGAYIPSMQQIAEEENVTVRTVQRDLSDAVVDMTVKLFGADGIRELAR